jgi:hypothetical protein
VRAAEDPPLESGAGVQSTGPMVKVGRLLAAMTFEIWVSRALLTFLLIALPMFPLFARKSGPAGGTVSFTLDFPNSVPDHYKITVSSEGRATYDSTGKLTPDVEQPEPFRLDFQMSPETTAKIFDLTTRAKYFEGRVDSGKKNLASTGEKTLTYQDGSRSTEAQYNYSPKAPVQELTTLFQNLSTTLEFGRRLDYYHRYQKLALDDELKRMEEMNREGNLGELQAVAPILRQIADDNTVINVARARALRLLSIKTASRSR